MKSVDDRKLGAITNSNRGRDAVGKRKKPKQLTLKTLVTESTNNSLQQQQQLPLTKAPAPTQAHRWDRQGKKNVHALV